MTQPASLQERPPYSPLYFLATLGAGGLMVTFFMFMMFWVPHPNQPVPIFEDIMAAFGDGPLALKVAIVVAMLGIAGFAVLLIKSLIWNLRSLSAFRLSEAYDALRRSNAETQLMAIPLALAMVVNGGFILGLVFVPGLWTVVEFLFPMAMVAFLLIGGYGLLIMRDFFGRVLIKGGFDCSTNNSFAQVLPAFAFAMVGVGMAAPAAMSSVALTVGVSFILSSFFIVVALLLAVANVILGLRAMMEHGASAESAPTLLVIVPLITVVTIAWLRQSHGLHVHFDVHGGAGETLSLLTTLLMVQLAILALGLTVLRRFGYVSKFVTGPGLSAGSYALVCPGVALSVMLHFWLNKGLVASGLVEKFSLIYLLISAVAVGMQVTMIWLVLKLNSKHMRREGTRAAVPAQ
ncbi:TsoY family (seleno)protein [Shimia marina]|uniref:Uncharacterized protein n=1 Tax=Shimia marina TaxID=321267 RepID=A0A0P1FB75_9RHOB|nr:hypothetical protein [Shimia marina]CUH51222.1 hypothetical protein SHM7688_00656 [Shimia marina]SFD54700.1 hypothetical protein SAMN04488037_101450 [Shimia marina]